MSQQPGFSWSDLAFGDTAPVNRLKATFIAAPRELSPARFKELIKQYLPAGNILLGLAEEDYVLGFENQPQFKVLRAATVAPLIERVNSASSRHKIYSLTYRQRDSKYVFEKLRFRRVVLVNGSWKYAFHTQAPYYVLANRHVPYDMVSPFTDETEARAFEQRTEPLVQERLPKAGRYDERGMLAAAALAASGSYDYSFQTGVALGRGQGNDYELLLASYNRVVPYQTYAMHHGAARERHFSPMHDLNHYDTNHAEVELLIEAGRSKLDLAGTTAFINLLPCPTCARMFSATDIATFVYTEDHSDGYAVKLLEASGKTVRRLVP